MGDKPGKLYDKLFTNVIVVHMAVLSTILVYGMQTHDLM